MSSSDKMGPVFSDLSQREVDELAALKMDFNEQVSGLAMFLRGAFSAEMAARIGTVCEWASAEFPGLRAECQKDRIEFVREAPPTSNIDVRHIVIRLWEVDFRVTMTREVRRNNGGLEVVSEVQIQSMAEFDAVLLKMLRDSVPDLLRMSKVSQ